MSMNLVTGPSPVHRPWLQAQRLAPRPSRRIRLAAVLAIAAATPLALPSTAADAADMPAKAPAARTYNWGGCYIGLNGGGASSHECWDLTSNNGVVFPTSVREGCHNATGGLVGGQIGYRWQSTNWVFGVEAQGDWANLSGSSPSATAIAMSVRGPAA